ncbi:hypothetical protein HN51_042197 [Arachis hypogaea]
MIILRRSWVLMHSIDLRRTNLKRILNTSLAGNYSILHLLKDGEDDEMALFVQINGKVIALRLKDHTRYDVFVFDFKIQKNPRHYYSFPGVMGWYRLQSLRVR